MSDHAGNVGSRPEYSRAEPNFPGGNRREMSDFLPRETRGGINAPARVSIKTTMIEDNTKAESPSYIYVPAGFNPSSYPGPIADHPDAARWLLNSIYFNRLLRNFSEDDPVNLNARLLGLVMGDINKVRPVREALEERRLISCDHSYVKGHKSFSFTLGPALKGARWQRYRSGSKAFTERVESFKAYVRNPAGFDVAVHDHLEKWARLVEISPDLDFNRLDFPEEAKEQLAIHQVEMIRDRYIRLTVCPYGRFHSNYSGLCREIRPYLKINNDPAKG